MQERVPWGSLPVMRLATLQWTVPLLLLGSCTYFRSATVPMPVVRHDAPAGDANGLIVMLPGMGDGPSSYVANGFVGMVHEVNPRFDVVCPDAHFGYYTGKSIAQRLHEDVLAGARDRYEHIWFIGISLGGMGSVVYASDHPENVDGVILLAPYMGSAEVIQDVRAAGGPRSWTSPPATAETSDERRRYHEMWSWYQNVITQPGVAPKLFLGYGEQDGFRDANAMVALALPPEQTMTLPGGHKWTVWQPLFRELVERALGKLALGKQH